MNRNILFPHYLFLGWLFVFFIAFPLFSYNSDPPISVYKTHPRYVDEIQGAYKEFYHANKYLWPIIKSGNELSILDCNSVLTHYHALQKNLAQTEKNIAGEGKPLRLLWRAIRKTSHRINSISNHIEEKREYPTVIAQEILYGTIGALAELIVAVELDDVVDFNCDVKFGAPYKKSYSKEIDIIFNNGNSFAEVKCKPSHYFFAPYDTSSTSSKPYKLRNIYLFKEICDAFKVNPLVIFFPGCLSGKTQNNLSESNIPYVELGKDLQWFENMRNVSHQKRDEINLRSRFNRVPLPQPLITP